MKSLLKGKYKLIKFINYAFYLIIFLFGFILGLFGKNILSFFNIFTIENVYASESYDYVYANPINVYSGETEEQYNNGYYGYNSVWTYDKVVEVETYMQNNHIYEYLETFTQYLYDNYADQFDFVVSFRLVNENFVTMGGGSGIYVSYYPKGELEYIPIYDQLSTYDLSYSYLSNEECLSKYSANYCNSEVPISNYGWDFFELISEDGTHYFDYLLSFNDLLSAYSPSLLYQQASFDEFSRYFPDYADAQKFGEKFFAIRDYKRDENNNVIGSSVVGVQPGYLPYTYAKKDLKKPYTNGQMFYHSTLPLVYQNEEIAWAIGTKLYLSGDVLPTYTSEGNNGGDIEFGEPTLDYSWLETDYRRVCSSNTSVAIGRENTDITDTKIYFDYDINYVSGHQTIWDIMFLDYNYIMSTSETIGDHNNPFYYSRLKYDENPALDPLKFGFSEFSYTFSDNTILVIHGENTTCRKEGESTVCNDSSSGIDHGGGSGVIGGTDHDIGENFGHTGQYCFYIDKRLYVSYLETSYTDPDQTYFPNFKGEIQTPHGRFDIDYDNEYFEGKIDDDPFSGANKFIKLAGPTFIFIGDLFSYFYLSIPIAVRYFIYAVLLIIFVIWFIDILGGK